MPADLLHGWLAGRSVARGLPAPVPEHGGWRVDTGSAAEPCRYVFPAPSPSVAALAETIAGPGVPIRVLAGDAALAALLPAPWRPTTPHWLMTGPAAPSASLPAGFRIEQADLAVHVVAADGTLAASGYGAGAYGVFCYDRIVTEPAYRRRGLGRVMMHALGQRAAPAATHGLVATAEGRALYERLGWRVVAPYAGAVIPG